MEESLRPVAYKMADFNQTKARSSELIEDLEKFRQQPA